MPHLTEIDAPRRRILFFAEAVTLAHLARPLRFARSLERMRHDITIAASGGMESRVRSEGFAYAELESIESRAFLAALAQGKPLFDTATLIRYVQNDLALIDRFKPDLVVGDFRLSLSASARLARVPYVGISSAYWSPFYRPPRWPVPALPLTRLLPLGLAQAAFSAVRPLAFLAHCGPLNAARRYFGLPKLPSDLRQIYTDADWVAYSDLPEVFPMSRLPRNHRYLGAVLWEPRAPLPPWWAEVPADRTTIYVTLGSSGAGALLPRIVEALSGLPVSLLVASAGTDLAATLPRNVFAATYLPGIQAANRARIVICNGGNLTCYQALASGALVIGIAGNLDQLLNIQGFERAGIGRTMRADRFDDSNLRRLVETLLGDDPPHETAEALRAACEVSRFEAATRTMVDEILA